MKLVTFADFQKSISVVFPNVRFNAINLTEKYHRGTDRNLYEAQSSDQTIGVIYSLEGKYLVFINGADSLHNAEARKSYFLEKAFELAKAQGDKVMAHVY